MEQKKRWEFCEREDCTNKKGSPRSKYCKEHASESHKKNQELTTLKLIIKLRVKS